MSFQEYTHNPTKVQALQVVRPFKKVRDAVTFSRIVNKADGRTFSHLLISAPGSLEVKRAEESDWIVKYPTGCTSVLTDEQFQRYYGDQEES